MTLRDAVMLSQRSISFYQEMLRRKLLFFTLLIGEILSSLGTGIVTYFKIFIKSF